MQRHHPDGPDAAGALAKGFGEAGAVALAVSLRCLTRHFYRYSTVSDYRSRFMPRSPGDCMLACKNQEQKLNKAFDNPQVIGFMQAKRSSV